MKTAVSLPDVLFEQGELAARKMKISRSRLYATALAEYLNRREEDAITGKLNEVYARVDSRLDAALRRAQARSLPDDSW